jgi:opacity protein-like surface antigen
MFKRIAVLRCGLGAYTVSLALVAAPYPALAQSVEDLRAEIQALRKENAALRERDRLAKENAALRKRLAPSPAPVTGAPVLRSPSAVEPSPREAHAADVPMKAPVPVVAAPSWAGFYFGGGVSREQRKTTQGGATVVSTNGTTTNTDVRSLDLEQFASAGHVLGGWLWQYGRFIAGLEGDYYFGGRTSKDPRYLVPEGCSAGVMQTGNFGCGAAAAFGSFQTRGHIRGIAGWEFTPRFMGFVAGGLAIGELGAGGIQAGGILASSPANPSAGSISSTYGSRMLYGYSWGGGVQAKLNESLVGRLEYVRDQYNGPGQPSITSTNTAGASSVTVTTNPQNVRIVNQALRASLIYRFDPNVPFYEATQRDFAAYGHWQGSSNAFAGFYAGVGVSQNNYDYAMTNSRTLTINDSNTPGVDISERTDLTLDGGKVAKNFMLGYRYQLGRVLVGVEREFVRGSRKDLDTFPGTGQFGSAGRDFICYSQFAPDIVCIGLNTTTGSVETRGRLRFVGGVEITPSLMAFAGYGRAYGRASGTSGGAQGIVWDFGGGAPLVGAATVTRRQSNDITGHTFGGGIEFKAMENLIFRADYWRDHYTWNAIVCGGAGFGGTTGNITVNSFAACSTPIKIRNEAFQASVIYQFWNPQGSGAASAPAFLLPQLIGGYNWTGFYAGAHGGYGWSHDGNRNLDGDGWLAGAQVGYNHQVNQLVFGVEADGSFTFIRGEIAGPGTGSQPRVFREEIEGLATLAGRLGYAWNNTLLYGKGGAAWVGNHLQFSENGAGNAREWSVGWVAGVGFEYGISPGLSFKLEYNHLNFGTRGYTFEACNNCGATVPFDVNLEQSINVVKFGLNYRLWQPAQVIARY